jgi:uncharacterized protein (DUF433 family)
MVALKIPPALGLGIYRISEVHRYAQIPYSTVYSWFKSRDLDLFDSDFVRVGIDDYSVSFHDLIDASVAHRFRHHGVKMRIVRKAYRELAKVLETTHPFCHRSLYTDGQTVVFRAVAQLKTKNLTEAIGKQQIFEEMRGMLENVAYSENDLAKWWDISPGVVLNPQIAMGQPTIKGTGVTTFVVRGAYHANHNNAGLVASLYGISPSQVKNAVDFEDSRRSAA